MNCLGMALHIAIICLCCVFSCNAYLFSDISSSCEVRCGLAVDHAYSCQCNDACIRFGDCCKDYQAVCKTATTTAATTAMTCPSSSVLQVSRSLWANDVNRVPTSAYQLNYQGQVPDHSTVDRASYTFFTRLDKTQLSKPTFKALIALLDNYNPNKGVTDTSSYYETREVNRFLDEILKTKVMDILLQYLKCKGTVKDVSGLRQLLSKLWFQTYPRSNYGTRQDTSGFEHVMVGEFKNSTTINGFHGWLSFFLKEDAGDINYRGYVRRFQPNLVGASFTWKGHSKSLGSFIVGSSPEFDLALFTLCFVNSVAGSASCRADLDGHSVTVRTYDTNGHVATAFLEM